MELQRFIALILSFTAVKMATSTYFSTIQSLLPSSCRNVATMTYHVNIQCSKKWSRPYATAFACPATFSSRGTARHLTGAILKAAVGEIEQGSDNINKTLNVKHWFTLTLPEGTCVGVTSIAQNHPKANHSTPLSESLLHEDEYTWGVTNVSSDVSRNSFYLGRMALRYSVKEMLQTSLDGSQKIDGGANNEMLLWKQIQSNPIRKDDFGRPILPDVIVGSISHKGECAVGLSRLRMNNSNCSMPNSDEIKSSVVKWREECPVNINEEEYGDDISNDGSLFDESLVVGIGIDLERIDGERGTRIQKKILTEKEQQDLGRLEAIGISKGEEVMLRFSLKESVYKAMHPVLCEYVGFQEAEIDPLCNGTAVVRLNFLNDRDTVSPRSRLMVIRSASWRKVNSFFLTSASVGLEVPRPASTPWRLRHQQSTSR